MDLKNIQIEVAGNGFPTELKRVRYKSGVDGMDDWAMVMPPPNNRLQSTERFRDIRPHRAERKGGSREKSFAVAERDRVLN